MDNYFSDEFDNGPDEEISEELDEEEDDFGLGIGHRFDPGYYADIYAVPRVCCGCNRVFTLAEVGGELAGPDHPFDDFCCDCLSELFTKWAVRYLEKRELAERLGFTEEEFFGW